MVYSAAGRYHLSLYGVLILLLVPSTILASRQRKSVLRGNKINADQLPFNGNIEITRRLKESDDTTRTKINKSKSKSQSGAATQQSSITSNGSVASTTVDPVAELESSGTGTITEPSVPAPIAETDNTTNKMRIPSPPDRDRVRIPGSPDSSRVNNNQESTSSSSSTSTNIEFPNPTKPAETGNTSERVREPIYPDRSVVHSAQDSTSSSSSTSAAETDSISDRAREPIYPDRSVVHSAQDTTFESRGDSTNTEGSLTKNWDDACSRQARNLIICVKATGGKVENCKSCVKAASKFSTNIRFALDSCGRETELCNGCGTFVEAYFSCGIQAPESGGQAGASFGGFIPDQLP